MPVVVQYLYLMIEAHLIISSKAENGIRKYRFCERDRCRRAVYAVSRSLVRRNNIFRIVAYCGELFITRKPRSRLAERVLCPIFKL